MEPEIAVEGKRRLSPLAIITMIVVFGMVGSILLPSNKSVRRKQAQERIEKTYLLTTKDVEGKLAPVASPIVKGALSRSDSLKAYVIWDASKKTHRMTDLRGGADYPIKRYVTLVTSTNSGPEYEWTILFNAFLIQKKNTDTLIDWGASLPSLKHFPSLPKTINTKYVGLDPKIKQQAEEMLAKNRILATDFGTSEIYVQDYKRKGYRTLGKDYLTGLLSDYAMAGDRSLDDEPELK